MKKLILALAAAAFLLPLAAQSASGKWSVELGAWYAQPRDISAQYATIVNYDTLANMGTATNSPERRWSPEIKLSYETPTWKVWLSYFHYDKTANGFASGTPGQSILSANYVRFSEASYGYPTVFADMATASTRLNQTDWALNIGRKFHPAKNWEMLVYTGVSRAEATLDNNFVYADNHGYLTPPGSSVVAMQSYSTGWGLNFGLINSFKASKHLAFNAGASIDMLSLKEDASFLQTDIDNTGYESIDFQQFDSKTTVSPAFKIFIEGQVNFTSNWYAKLGYRYRMMRDVFNDSLTPSDTLASLYFGLSSGATPHHNLSEEGFYASVGFSW